MKLIFRGDPGELALGGGLSRTSIDMHGVHFQTGVPVDVSHLSEAQKRKLSTNNHFEIVADEASAVVAPAPIAESDELAEEAAEAAAHAERASKRKAKAAT